MFSSLRDFFYRHKQKFIIGSTVIGGAVLLKYYAEYKFIQWHNCRTSKILHSQKRKLHYENTRRTVNATVFSLANNLQDVIIKELDADSLLQAVRDQPQHKRSIWEQLKIIGFSRAISAVYVAALTAPTLHIQLMILGGYTFGDLTKTGPTGTTITQRLQQKYLSAVHGLVEQGLPKLIQQVTKAVTQVVGGLPLTQRLSLIHIETIFQQVKLYLNGENMSDTSSNNSELFKLKPWSQYILFRLIPSGGEDEEESMLNNMFIETSDILDSDDFCEVVDVLVQRGFNHILDRMADFYPFPNSTNVPCEYSENVVDNIEPENQLESLTKDVNLERIITKGVTLATTVPVAKLIPVLSRVIHAALSPTPGQLLHIVLTNDKLNSLSANVYEAFAVPLEPS